MVQTPVSNSAPINNAAKDDVVGTPGDYTFTIADLLKNDPGGANKLADHFFFGTTSYIGYAGIDFAHGGVPTHAQQTAYLAAHGITANADFTEFTIGDGVGIKDMDIDYMVQIGNKGTWSVAHVDVNAAPPPPPPVVVEKAGDMIWQENFDDYNVNSQGSWGFVNLSLKSDGHAWALKDGQGGWLQASGEVVQGSAFPGSMPATSGNYWLDTQNSPGGINIHNWFVDPTGGKFLLSFDIGTHDFGTGPMQETAADASFEVRIDDKVVASFKASDFGDHDVMKHIDVVVDGAAVANVGHLISLVDTTPSQGNFVGFAIDSITVHDWGAFTV